MGLLQKLETEISYSKERVLAPLLLLPPSESLSKQVILAYLKSQKEIYQLMLEATKNLNRFEQEQLPSVLIRGCESLENIFSLLNDRTRLKYFTREPDDLEDNISRVNTRILEALGEKAISGGSLGSSGKEIDSSEAFVKMLLRDEIFNTKTPLYSDIMDAKGLKETDAITDFKLMLEANQIKAYHKKVSKGKDENSTKAKFLLGASFAKPNSDRKKTSFLDEKKLQRIVSTKVKTAEIGSTKEEQSSLTKRNQFMKAPASITSLSNFGVQKPGGPTQSVPSSDLASAHITTAQFLPNVETFGFIDSPSPGQTTFAAKLSSGLSCSPYLVNKVALPVVLLLHLRKMKRLFFKKTKVNLILVVRDLERALNEEKLKNEALTNVLSESKNSFLQRHNNSQGPVLGSSKALGLDSAKLDTDLPNGIKSTGSLLRGSDFKDGSNGSMHDAPDEVSVRPEIAIKLRPRFDSAVSIHQMMNPFRFDMKASTKFSIKELSDVLRTVHDDRKLMANHLSPEKNYYHRRQFYSDQNFGYSKAKLTAIYYRNLAESLTSYSTSIAPANAELFRNINDSETKPTQSKCPPKKSLNQLSVSSVAVSTPKGKTKSMSLMKKKLETSSLVVAKKKQCQKKAGDR